ncbi:MAG: hypothetical protein QNJ89_12880 [Acidimicrobiia bacterium]|nr:hypothetical protein [Acidimicrobiia bacterium]
MLIVWRGLGWLVPVFAFAALLLSQLAVDAVYGDGFYTANAWPKQVAFIVAAFSIAILGAYLNHTKRQMLVDEETGEVVGKAPAHSLFFIPIEYWAIVVLALLFMQFP